MTTKKMINLGCGPSYVEGWVNCDYSLGLMLAKVRLGFLTRSSWDARCKLVDLTRPLPFEENSVDAVYLCHVLEHLHRQDGQDLIGEIYRILRPGGFLRIVVPNISSLLDGYRTGKISAAELLEQWMVAGPRKTSLPELLHHHITCHHHVCMYDDASVVRALEKSGFSAELKRPFESAIQNIDLIEQKSRTEGPVTIAEGTK